MRRSYILGYILLTVGVPIGCVVCLVTEHGLRILIDYGTWQLHSVYQMYEDLATVGIVDMVRIA